MHFSTPHQSEICRSSTLAGSEELDENQIKHYYKPPALSTRHSHLPHTAGTGEPSDGSDFNIRTNTDKIMFQKQTFDQHIQQSSRTTIAQKLMKQFVSNANLLPLIEITCHFRTVHFLQTFTLRQQFISHMGKFYMCTVQALHCKVRT